MAFDLRSWVVSISIFLAVTGIETSVFAASRPNVLLIITDDQGYNDVAAFGSKALRTPTLDSLAGSGARLTNFYAQPTCGPSRAALMTGYNPARIGMNFDPLPGSPRGLPDEPTTLGEMFRSVGYRTGYFGKWHLGDRPEHLPMAHGFDQYFGLPYSNDMWPFHHNMPLPEGGPADERLLAAKQRVEFTGAAHRGKLFSDPSIFPPLPLLDGATTVESNPDQRFLSQRYTTRTIEFIEEADDRPFFAMLAYTSSHVPLFAHPEFVGRSDGGLYGDVIEEIDARIGQILDVLKKTAADKNTIVIFVSDNGPWLEYGIDAGSATPFQGGKATTREGGWRVPAIFNWPGHIPVATIDGVVSLADLLPTLADMVDIKPNNVRPLDGKSRWQALQGIASRSDDEFLYFADFSGQGAISPLGKQLHAIRVGAWKLQVYTHRSRWFGWWRGYEVRPVALYNLAFDPMEATDRQNDFPDLVDKVSTLAALRLNTLCNELPVWVDTPCN